MDHGGLEVEVTREVTYEHDIARLQPGAHASVQKEYATILGGNRSQKLNNLNNLLWKAMHFSLCLSETYITNTEKLKW